MSTYSEYETLQVTHVQVFPVENRPEGSHMVARAEIVLNDQFIVRGLRVMDGENGLFVGYPVDPNLDGDTFLSTCKPVTRALREHIEDAVLEKYQELRAARGDEG